jgi:hypothetical protein
MREEKSSKNLININKMNKSTPIIINSPILKRNETTIEFKKDFILKNISNISKNFKNANKTNNEFKSNLKEKENQRSNSTLDIKSLKRNREDISFEKSKFQKSNGGSSEIHKNSFYEKSSKNVILI